MRDRGECPYGHDARFEEGQMPHITVGDENGWPVELHYEDHGRGQPLVLIHGYPSNSDSWERQECVLLDAGYRVIRYDRRGFGASSRPSLGYDYDTLAGDLHTLLEALALDEVVLVGCSMGTGEVVRYLGTYGCEGVAKAALLAALPPFLLQTDDNPEGAERTVFDDAKTAILGDRYAYFTTFLDDMFNVDVLGGSRVSAEALRASFNVAAAASPHATYACVDAWLTDFRADLPMIDLPLLVVHGTDDRILPFAATAQRLPALVPGTRLVAVEHGPHHIAWTHAAEVNCALLEFLA
jgi:non-heme chloroperoxidase